MQEGYFVTEAGFDFTMGGERFMKIKCRASGLPVVRMWFACGSPVVRLWFACGCCYSQDVF